MNRFKTKKNALFGSVLSFNSIYNHYYLLFLKSNQQTLHFKIIYIFRMTIVDKTNGCNVFGPSFTDKNIG
jgi:hypothetical protein